MRSIRMEETRFPPIMEDGKVAECEALLLVEQLRYQELPGLHRQQHRR